MKQNSFIQPLFYKKHAQPVCWLDDLTLIYYWSGKFILFNFDTKKETLIGKIPLSFKEKILSLFPLLRRLFRQYIFSPVFDESKNEILFSFNGYFCSYNLNSNTFCREQKLNHAARRLLSICLSSNGKTYYGEYPTKKDNQNICIYERDQNKNHSIVYSFKPGTIRHIHLLKEYNGDLFCFTGDENNESNILCFPKKTFTCEPIHILSGKQDFRTCVATFKNDFLYYLTDNPYFENKLFVYNIITSSFEKFFPIEGSVVYGLCSNTCIYFSTCVEYNLMKDEQGNNVCLKIDGTSGGIRSNESILYYYDITNNKLKKITAIKKDCLSIKYFGFGTFMFTCNTSSKYLAVFSHSLKRNETLFVYNVKKELN
ncbi:MAG TPA: hypothetical protein DDW20_05135 [Firmicutes bacterium]|nr:hypothetical protein [Bacillota bacterium]